MLNDIVANLLERDLNKLAEELKAYAEEDKIWLVQNGISNSAGNLTLHLIGNLNHFIGATLGNTGYVRNRDSEFSSKNIPRAELLASLEKTKSVVKTTLSQLKEEDLENTFPVKIQDKEITTGHMLTHLATHLAYHLGQVNYHRRLLA
jgi:uncharacterized damage-inducible protein DinB